MKRRYLKDYIRDENEGFRYTGRFYCSAISDDERKKHSFTGIVAGVTGILLVLAAISVNCLGNRTLYVVLPLEFTLLCYGYYLAGIITFFKAPNRMELRIYGGAYLRTIQSLTIAILLQFFSLVGELFLIVRYEGNPGKEEFYLLFWILLALGLNVLLWIKQKKLIAAVIEE